MLYIFVTSAAFTIRVIECCVCTHTHAHNTHIPGSVLSVDCQCTIKKVLSDNERALMWYIHNNAYSRILHLLHHVRMGLCNAKILDWIKQLFDLWSEWII